MAETSQHFYDGEHERAMMQEGSSVLPDSVDFLLSEQDDFNELVRLEVESGRLSLEDGEDAKRGFRLFLLGFIP